MKNEFLENSMRKSFSLRKIPASIKEETPDIITNADIDKIKIIELASAIDKWEQEILFSEKGFYFLKGREASEKKADYLEELNKFAASEINSMKFISASSKTLASGIKDAKIKAVREQLELYAQQELNQWEMETYENALKSCIKRALLYKSSPDVIKNAYYNGIKILETISEKEDWSKKLYGYKKKQFELDFHSALIDAFIKAEDIAAYYYFNKYKDFFAFDEKEKLEKRVSRLRINITAYNWAQEIFSYKLTPADYEKELNKIEDEEIKKAADKFYIEAKAAEKRSKMLELKIKNETEWKEIIAAAEHDAAGALLNIDYSSTPESIKRKQDYIRQILHTGAVKTDINEFSALIQCAFNDFKSFKEKDIQDYRGCLSKEDFEIFEKIQNYDEFEFQKLEFDFKYACSFIESQQENKEELQYEILKIYFNSLTEYRIINKKDADLEHRGKILDELFRRFSNNIKNTNKEKEVKN